MFHLDLGNVPAWLGAASLPLTCLQFAKERQDRRREQASRVAIWCGNLVQERVKPPILAVDVHAKNSSSLPVDVQEIEIEWHPHWRGPKPMPGGRMWVQGISGPQEVTRIGRIGVIAPGGAPWCETFRLQPKVPRNALDTCQVTGDVTVSKAIWIDGAGRKRKMPQRADREARTRATVGWLTLVTAVVLSTVTWRDVEAFARTAGHQSGADPLLYALMTGGMMITGSLMQLSDAVNRRKTPWWAWLLSIFGCLFSLAAVGWSTGVYH